MTDHKPIKTVSIIGLGAIGSFFAFQLKAVLGDRLRIIAGGERKDRLEREGVTVNGVNHHSILFPRTRTAVGIIRTWPLSSQNSRPSPRQSRI